MPGTAGDTPPTPAAFSRVATVISLEQWRQEPVQASIDPRRLELAVTIARLYENEGLSLADPDTAAGFRVALGVVSVLLDGALRHGALEQSSEQIHAYMQTALRDARQAPDLI